ncbi:MAG: hypothetical protein ACD_46C00396G0002 [uncultured bacterium]|nr:MAG: hypothetical protein ACD_46C00396G0002 [uncultured bacterium]OGT47567.1 MAG: hypothetical protein A3E83_06700 [Gammaproteobacteria bacterium RIFCSPHIGHO2_12_FULL_41_20]HLB43552.1 SDR family oxidoreductase [Gammaproteobacteria bacterium]
MSSQKIALITGSSQGLGFELAKSLDRNNMRLILTGRSLPKLKALLQQLSSKKTHVIFHGDLTDDTELQKMIDNIKNQQIYPNIIIHSLGKSFEGDEFPVKKDILRKSMQINLEIALELNNAFLPYMMQNQFGRIVHISSDGSLTGRCAPAYAAAKSAVNAYVKSAARYYTKYNVMLCAVLPNVFEHENSAWAEKKRLQPEYYQQRISQMPMGRFAHPAEIASYVTDLVCNQSIMCAGSLIQLTGGY